MKGTLGIKIRRDNAKKLLELQLTRGTKPEKVNGRTTNKMTPLTDADKNRIKHEIDKLNQPKNKIAGQ